MLHSFIYQIHARHKVDLIIVASHKMRKAFRRVGCHVIDIIVIRLRKQCRDKLGIAKVSLQPTRVGGHVFPESARQVVSRRDQKTQLQTMLRYVRADETGRPGHKNLRFVIHDACK